MANTNYTPDLDDDLQDLDPEQAAMRGKNGSAINEEIEIDNEKSQVASTPGKNILLIAILIIAAVAFLYHMVFKEDQSVAEQEKTKELIASQPVTNAVSPTREEDKPKDVGVVETPDLPDMTDLTPPPSVSSAAPETAPQSAEPEFPPQLNGNFEPESIPEPQKPDVAIPEALPTPTQAPAPLTEASEAPLDALPDVGPTEEQLQAAKMARRQAEGIIIAGDGNPSNPVSFAASGKIKPSEAEKVNATAIGNTQSMIAQGKIIDAVLETAINTDLEGSLRATVSRDTYAESGRRILIPHGSRLIGKYDNGIERGQRRIAIVWQRVIRPDGIDVAINSPATDPLGRSGVTGIVDNKYFEVFSNSILISLLTIGGAIATEKIQDSQGVSSTNTTTAEGSSSSTQNGKPSDFAVMQAATDLTDKAKSIGQDILDSDPTIIVQQGTRIKVFVNRDLIFQSEDAGLLY